MHCSLAKQDNLNEPKISNRIAVMNEYDLLKAFSTELLKKLSVTHFHGFSVTTKFRQSKMKCESRNVKLTEF
jgi:hypothetical protein